MAGTFTHFNVCDAAKRKRASIGIDLWRLLNKYSEFLLLGAVSPDLTYLSFKAGKINWADVMHYEKTNSTVITGHEVLKTTWALKNPADEVKFVWLLGYVSHLVADATIHPIVQAIVGPYEQNKEEHRICEMIQDAMFFNEYRNNDIYYAEFSSILKFCGKSKYFDELMEFWKTQSLINYPDKNEEPNPKLWFKTYTEAIDAAEGGSGVVALFRHMDVTREYIYKTKAEILSDYPEYSQKYYKEVKLPGGSSGTFKKEGIERTINNIVTVWNIMYTGLSANIIVAENIKNWNLDTGVDMDSPNRETTYWV